MKKDGEQTTKVENIITENGKETMWKTCQKMTTYTYMRGFASRRVLQGF